MAHWLNTYPHEIYASVILKDKKIVNWKVGQRKLSDTYLLSSHSYREICFTVNNEDEHDEVFEKKAPEWFRQWKIHEDAIRFKPYRTGEAVE